MELDCAKAEKGIREFMRARVDEACATGVVIGLSGGVDSALVASLCAGALGRDKVLALILPDRGDDAKDAVSFAELLGIDHKVIDISDIVSAVQEACETNDRVALGNVKPRVRMMLLYGHANAMKRLVVGTGNKSELLIGYFTKFGDGGVDMLPIGGLYKTQVWKLARHMKIPENIVAKAPTAGLWPGQTDEDEIGMSYTELDTILGALETNRSVKDVAEKIGISVDKVLRVANLCAQNKHKLGAPPVAKLD